GAVVEQPGAGQVGGQRGRQDVAEVPGQDHVARVDREVARVAAAGDRHEAVVDRRQQGAVGWTDQLQRIAGDRDVALPGLVVAPHVGQLQPAVAEVVERAHLGRVVQVDVQPVLDEGEPDHLPAQLGAPGGGAVAGDVDLDHRAAAGQDRDLAHRRRGG